MILGRPVTWTGQVLFELVAKQKWSTVGSEYLLSGSSGTSKNRVTGYLLYSFQPWYLLLGGTIKQSEKSRREEVCSNQSLLTTWHCGEYFITVSLDMIQGFGVGFWGCTFRALQPTADLRTKRRVDLLFGRVLNITVLCVSINKGGGFGHCPRNSVQHNYERVAIVERMRQRQNRQRNLNSDWFHNAGGNFATLKLPRDRHCSMKPMIAKNLN